MTSVDEATWIDQDDSQVDEESYDVLNVRVVADSRDDKGIVPEFGALSSFPVPQNGAAGSQQYWVQILQRRPAREKAWIYVGTLGAATAVILSTRPDSLSGPNPQGFQIVSAPYTIPWENQQPCYATAIGAALTISVLDQTYAADLE
jgi:hypothetical protein